MTEDKAQELMLDLFDEATMNSGNGFEEFDMVRTFEDAGVLTQNKGLVLYMADGSEFQLRLVRSK